MRQILFRGKDIYEGEWVEGYLVKFDKEVRIFEANKSLLTPTGFYTGTTVMSETVGQFTGLTDKNGVKIFEGDKCIDINGNERIVAYEYGLWSFQYYENPSMDWEVTENIHDKKNKNHENNKRIINTAT